MVVSLPPSGELQARLAAWLVGDVSWAHFNDQIGPREVPAIHGVFFGKGNISQIPDKKSGL